MKTLALVCLFVPVGLPTPLPATVPAQDPAAPQVEEVDYKGKGYRYPVTLAAPLEPGVAEAAKAAGKPEPERTELSLTGVGLRTKTWFDVWVYTFGLYVETEHLTRVGAGWKGRSVKELYEDQGVYEAFLQDDCTKSLRLIFCRDVSAEDVVDAFTDSLEPRIEAAKANEALGDGTAALKTFRGFFDDVDKLRKRNTLTFTWLPGGKLLTEIDGELQPVVESKALSWALFDVYLGTDPIQKGGKNKLVERLPGLLAR